MMSKLAAFFGHFIIILLYLSLHFILSSTFWRRPIGIYLVYGFALHFFGYLTYLMADVS